MPAGDHGGPGRLGSGAMTIEPLTRAEHARERGLVDTDGNPSERAIAQILRDAAGRWGLSPRRALLQHAREELRAGDVPVNLVPGVLERLVALGECAEVTVGHEVFIAPSEPRWIAIGGGRAALLGSSAVPSQLTELPGLPPRDVIVRIIIESEEQAATLEASGARQIPIQEWLHPIGYLRHVAHREGKAVRADQWDLAQYWERLRLALDEEGLLLGADAELRAVVGEPGGFFGRLLPTGVEGRWAERLPDGVWCAYRRGHGADRWLPTLVSVDGDDRRALDLFDDDEWQWALLARSKAVGVAEVVHRTGGEELVTWPLPLQLRAAMDIIGVPAGPWRWRVEEGAPDVWSLLK